MNHFDVVAIGKVRILLDLLLGLPEEVLPDEFHEMNYVKEVEGFVDADYFDGKNPLV